MLGVPEAQVRQHSLRMPAHRSLQACEAACEHAAHLHTCTPELDDARSQTPASQQAAPKRRAERAQALGTPARGGTRSAAADARPGASAVGPCRGPARAARRARAPARRGARAAGRPEGAGACEGPARGARLHDEAHGQQGGQRVPGPVGARPAARACTTRHAGSGRARGCRGLWGPGPRRAPAR